MQNELTLKLNSTKERINKYRACFSSADGAFVLKDLKKLFDRSAYVPRKNMTFDEVAYNEGVRSIFKFIEGVMDDANIERINKIIEKESES